MAHFLCFFVAICLLISSAVSVPPTHQCYNFEECSNDTRASAFSFLRSNQSVEDKLNSVCSGSAPICYVGSCISDFFRKNDRVAKYIRRAVCRPNNRNVMVGISQDSPCYRNPQKLDQVKAKDAECLGMVFNDSFSLDSLSFDDKCSLIDSSRHCSMNFAKDLCGIKLGWIAGILGNAYANYYFKDCVMEGKIDMDVKGLLGMTVTTVTNYH